MEVSGLLHASAASLPRERVPITHWIGDWVGPRAVLDAVVKRKVPSPPPPGIEPQNPDRPARSLVAIPTELSRLSTQYFLFLILTDILKIRHWTGKLRPSVATHRRS
jgi:hypothetical protein